MRFHVPVEMMRIRVALATLITSTCTHNTAHSDLLDYVRRDENLVQLFQRMIFNILNRCISSHAYELLKSEILNSVVLSRFSDKQSTLGDFQEHCV